MIRKDFTLQNYVGTGGKCDARAVRCHERIARWHTMCEHQLSHIDDFAKMQSQQNIQELGQTIKVRNHVPGNRPYDSLLGALWTWKNLTTTLFADLESILRRLLKPLYH